MGCFTWTFANLKPVKDKNGDFNSRCKLSIRGYATVICPDNTVIQEMCYEGYGIFGGHDIYELVVDWNKPYLEKIFNKLNEVTGEQLFWGNELKNLAIAYQNDDNEKISEEISILKTTDRAPYIASEWKRVIGITIAAEHNDLLPYPIKITSNVQPKPYDQLQPSILCQ